MWPTHISFFCPETTALAHWHNFFYCFYFIICVLFINVHFPFLFQYFVLLCFCELAQFTFQFLHCQRVVYVLYLARDVL